MPSDTPDEDRRPRQILSLDVARKKQIIATVRDHADRTNEMTIAARNRKIEDEGDLDAFLKRACAWA